MVSGFQKLQRTHNPFALWFQLSCKNQMNRNFRSNAYQKKAVIVSNKFGKLLHVLIHQLNPNCHSSVCDRSKLTKPFATNETEPKTHLVTIMNLVFHFSNYELNLNWKTKKTLQHYGKRRLMSFASLEKKEKYTEKIKLEVACTLERWKSVGERVQSTWYRSLDSDTSTVFCCRRFCFGHVLESICLIALHTNTCASHKITSNISLQQLLHQSLKFTISLH